MLIAIGLIEDECAEIVFQWTTKHYKTLIFFGEKVHEHLSI